MLALCACACAHRAGSPARPATAEARAFYYTDESGLDVTTVTAGARQPVSENVTLAGSALAEHILVEREALDPAARTSGGAHSHHNEAPDVVTSASTIIASGEGASEWRFEGLLRGELETSPGGAPLILGLDARASTEPDYTSVSTKLDGELALAQEDTVLASFVGYGYDRVDPLEAPPAQDDEWPAHHERLIAGASISQALLPVLLVSGGVNASFQWGRLANPYRRALVRTTLFPEIHPDTRQRYTFFGGLSWSILHTTALHLRSAFYVDSWDVHALTPELALAQSLGGETLVTLRYRFYMQGRASFYESQYDGLDALLSGDVRLGRITEHATGINARTTLFGRGHEPGTLTLSAFYDLAFITYRDLPRETITSHTFGVGALVGY